METDQVSELKLIAKYKYNEDCGEMYECYDHFDYMRDIERFKTADKAWENHIKIVEIQRENQACYDLDSDIPF